MSLIGKLIVFQARDSFGNPNPGIKYGWIRDKVRTFNHRDGPTRGNFILDKYLVSFLQGSTSSICLADPQDVLEIFDSADEMRLDSQYFGKTLNHSV